MKTIGEELKVSLVYVDPYEGDAAIELKRIQHNLKQSITHQLITNQSKFSTTHPQKQLPPPSSHNRSPSFQNFVDTNIVPLLVVGGFIGIVILYRTFFLQNYICVCPRPTCYGYSSRLWRYILDQLGYEDTPHY
ncbi:uncharacterized protein LOC120903715 isoform X2 [Anopheles arabiensis]|uniref:uncharacterized protein LOC120903715 isoform X2 n=1 Tax=Anopheles arabiensis TaxID=7173 RepID=UPI001AAD585C|nr:uncharacterized protein LOC120903715 isoform X2 [Anopheles arabiensis]